jgi:hypothetical protein
LRVSDWLRARLAAVPDLTLRALVVELGERGVVTSYGSVWRIVHDAGIASKKTLFATEQDRPDVARKRQRWKTHQGGLDPTRLVFIDETWAKTNMTPLRGWAPCGRKLLALLPRAAERTVEATWRRIGELLKAFTPQECAKYFRNAGYASI